MAESWIISTAHAERLRQQVSDGHYRNEDDALEHALHLLEAFETQNAEKLVWLRQALREADQSGPPVEFSLERIREKGLQRLTAMRAAE